MKVTRSITVLLLLLCLSFSIVAAKKSKDDEDADGSRMKATTFKGLELRGIGPALMSGRVADIAIHPDDQSTWYVAVGSGNVWKTTNAGTTWKPIFDDKGSYSVGCVTIDPSNPEIVWVGSGENVSGRHVGYGDGVYKSLDGGKSWSRVGLENSEHISKIIVDPRDSNVVYVAAQGPLWSGGGERGLYKTIDGGETRLIDKYLRNQAAIRGSKQPAAIPAGSRMPIRTPDGCSLKGRAQETTTARSCFCTATPDS